MGNIDPLADYDGEFAILSDFFLGKPSYQSSVMLFKGGFGKELAEGFFKDTQKAMHDHSPAVAPAPGKWGDQYYIERHVKNADYLQDLFGQNQLALGGNSQAILCVVMNNGPFAAASWKQGFCIQRRCGRWLSVACGGSASFQRR